MKLSRILRINDHPIAHCADKIKEQYAKGLGCVLHKMTNGNHNMKVLFAQWGYSILHKDVAPWFSSDNINVIKGALSLHRQGLTFFRTKRQFYFDCFYLTEAYNPSLLTILNSFLHEKGCTIFTKTALKETFAYFTGGADVLNVDDTLKQHRQLNKEFLEMEEFRVLVVATVSAGKSTLINALTGHDFNKATYGVCTTHVCKILNKPLQDGITYQQDDLWNYCSEVNAHSSSNIHVAAFHFESTLCDRRIALIDTPGVNNAQDSGHLKITSDAIKANNYDLVLFISNAQYNGTNDEHNLLQLLKTSTKKPILFVLNQLDAFKSKTDDIAKMIADYGNELKTLGYSHPEIFPISARFAAHLRMESQLDEDEQEELEIERKRFSKPFFDLQSYQGVISESDIHRSGIVWLEKAIIKHLIKNNK